MSEHGHHSKAVLKKYKIKHAESLQSSVFFISPSVIVITGFRRSLVCLSDMHSGSFSGFADHWAGVTIHS